MSYTVGKWSTSVVRIAVVFLYILLIAKGIDSQERQTVVKIVRPTEGTTISSQSIVEGQSSNPNTTIWIIVHPLEVSDYWVQPRVSVRSNGQWAANVYVGRSGDLDAGKRFELLAVANPRTALKEGAVLADWPEAEARSEVVMVVHK
jgi:hypothetical protein